ncbi:hypothetical protein [Massilia endophytica]|uniref:hypothetical protein n=1 Tax=Massilia endophytica TaxID=2899220 RepID=UPI001E5721C7|nr:hypothetical protein [Massilia endophytica]UGQ46849.1 hypothetical protein LSQ66_24325 [Massilia endophytica]
MCPMPDFTSTTACTKPGLVPASLYRRPPGRRHEAMLAMHQIFAVGDYLVSDNGLFTATLREDGTFAIFRGVDSSDPAALLWSSGKAGAPGDYFALVQADGNFCIYRGADLEHNEGWHWGSQITAKGSDFYAAMQDDGNFSIRKGRGPADSCGLIWASGATDRVESIVEVLHIDYDLGGSCVLRTSPASLYSETIGNHAADAEMHRLVGAVAVTETRAWTNSTSARYSADAHFMAAAPQVDGDAVVLSAEGDRFMPNGAHTSTRNWGFDTPVEVAPGSTVRAAIGVTYTTIAVPYVMLGMLRFESGATAAGPLKGAFMGTNAHSLTASFVAQKGEASRRIERALQPLR